MTHPLTDHLILDAAAARIARRNHLPAHLLTAPGPGSDHSRTAAALRRAAGLSTHRLRSVQRSSADRWRQISRLAQAVTDTDDDTAAALPQGRAW